LLHPNSDSKFEAIERNAAYAFDHDQVILAHSIIRGHTIAAAALCPKTTRNGLLGTTIGIVRVTLTNRK
jgi:hypothetical protein